jgi:hypothetical protein
MFNDYRVEGFNMQEKYHKYKMTALHSRSLKKKKKPSDSERKTKILGGF